MILFNSTFLTELPILTPHYHVTQGVADYSFLYASDRYLGAADPVFPMLGGPAEIEAKAVHGFPCE